MLQFINYLKHFFANEEGQSMTEYALILVLIAVVAVVTLTLLGPQIAAIFTTIGASL
jgi:pilus assembly protein Flp/PilA